MGIAITAQEKAILQKISIPPRPEALIKIGEEAKKPEPNVSRIASTIAADVGISSAVLQVVNSAAFRRAKEIQSIQQAVMTLGFKRLLPLVKSVALKSSMGQADKLASFWETATSIANAASISADLLQKPALKDHSYMLGLFHNAGIPIMLLQYDDYPEIMAVASEQGWPETVEQERTRYGTSHTTISAILGQKWKLPAVMIEVIYYQQDVEGMYTSGELSSTALDLLSVLKLARHGVQYDATGSPNDPEWAQVEDPIMERYNLSEVEIENLREQLLEKMSET